MGWMIQGSNAGRGKRYFFKRIHNESLQNNHIYFYLSMTACFTLQRPSSGHHYETFKIMHNIVQL